MLSPRTALAISAFSAAHPGFRLLVPQSPTPRFDAYYQMDVASQQLKFVELEPSTWTVPPIKRSCIDADLVVLWVVARSKFDSFYFVYCVVDQVDDECTIESDVLSKRDVELVAPYDRHVSEWFCGVEESCALPQPTCQAAWRIVPIPRKTFDRATWDVLARPTHGQLPIKFRYS